MIPNLSKNFIIFIYKNFIVIHFIYVSSTELKHVHVPLFIIHVVTKKGKVFFKILKNVELSCLHSFRGV